MKHFIFVISILISTLSFSQQYNPLAKPNTYQNADNPNYWKNKMPHAAYEFKIPLEQIGFKNEYGFFMQVFDRNDVMTYPTEHSGKYPQKIPSPEQCGLMISPDSSIISEHFNQN